MKTDVTDFAEYLESFFTDYLAAEKGVSKHTVRSYRDTFVLLIDYMVDVQGIFLDKLSMSDLSRDVILSFLNWLQDSRNNSVSTRNQRYAAIRSFFEFLERKDPTRLATWQSVRSVKCKRSPKASVKHLTVDAIKCLLEEISPRKGMADAILLCFHYFMKVVPVFRN